MSNTTRGSYDPREFAALTFHDATARFRDGSDTPRAYLERWLATIAQREPVVRPSLRVDAAARRWGHAGRGAVDGQQHTGMRITAMARWMLSSVKPVVAH
jgi:hypothetical protein